MKTLTADTASMQTASEHVLTPPPKAWIADRIRTLNEPLGERTRARPALLRPAGSRRA
ncbi:MAG: hypothetical protein L6Q84_11015 [Polyangiaceae bacterium]|nr:hypothetical protein [Polyangiaceae bacterium]